VNTDLPQFGTYTYTHKVDISGQKDTRRRGTVLKGTGGRRPADRRASLGSPAKKKLARTLWDDVTMPLTQGTFKWPQGKRGGQFFRLKTLVPITPPEDATNKKTKEQQEGQ